MNLNTHPVPENIGKRITEKGGLSSNGSPLFRVIWGGDRMTVIGGPWKTYDESGNITGEVIEERIVTKYGQWEERWIMEMWCPPENYGDEERWEIDTVEYFDGKKIYKLGPFPRQGEYEMLMPLETPEHSNPRKSRKFVPLTSTICDAMVAVAVKNRELPMAIRMEYFRDQRNKREERSKQYRADKLSEIGRAFSGNEHIIVPGRMVNGRIIV